VIPDKFAIHDLKIHRCNCFPKYIECREKIGIYNSSL
jgi:hypothetical protein